MKKKVRIRLGQDFLYANDIYIRDLILPARVKAFCTDQHNQNIICLNSTSAPQTRKKALDHELHHILRDDLHSDCLVQKIENF